MLRRSTFVALVATVPVVAWGTGFGGSDAPTRIPVPARDFTAVVEDLSGQSYTVTDVTFDGEVVVGGKLGEADIAVPFERIAEVRIEPTGEEDKRIAFVRTVGGDSVKIVVDHDVPCFGATPWGNVRIEVGRIRKVTFKPATPP